MKFHVFIQPHRAQAVMSGPVDSFREAQQWLREHLASGAIWEISRMHPGGRHDRIVCGRA